MLADTNRRILTDHRTGFDRRISDRRRGALRASPVPERRMGQLRTLEPRRRMVRRRGEQASFLARVRHRLYPTPLRPDPFDVLLAEATRQSVERVLDIGAGRGGIRPRFIPGSVLLVGCDATDAVLEHPTIDRGVQCDGERLPFADQSFDVCCMRYVIEHLRHPRRAFEEAYRVLRPAGRLVFVTPNAWYYASIAARVIPNRAHPTVVHWLTGRRESDVYPTVYAANTRARLRNQLRAVGFRERTLTFHQWWRGRWSPQLARGRASEQRSPCSPRSTAPESATATGRASGRSSGRSPVTLISTCSWTAGNHARCRRRCTGAGSSGSSPPRRPATPAWKTTWGSTSRPGESSIVMCIIASSSDNRTSRATGCPGRSGCSSRDTSTRAPRCTCLSPTSRCWCCSSGSRSSCAGAMWRGVSRGSTRWARSGPRY